MKTNKLTLRVCVVLTFILCLFTKFWSQQSPNIETENTLILFIAVDLCCSVKVERLTKSFSISVTIGT